MIITILIIMVVIVMMIIMIMIASIILPIGTMVNPMMRGSIENPLQRTNTLNLYDIQRFAIKPS